MSTLEHWNFAIRNDSHIWYLKKDDIASEAEVGLTKYDDQSSNHPQSIKKLIGDIYIATMNISLTMRPLENQVHRADAERMFIDVALHAPANSLQEQMI